MGKQGDEVEARPKTVGESGLFQWAKGITVFLFSTSTPTCPQDAGSIWPKVEFTPLQYRCSDTAGTSVWFSTT